LLARRGNLLLAGIALAVAVAAALAIVIILSRGSPPSSSTSVAVGETIYRTGTFEGRTIPRTGGYGGMMGGMGSMMSAGCASCHGGDGHGISTQAFTAPKITYANLTNPKGMLAPDGSRGPTYTDATLKRAVTTGIDPEGGHLAAPMPQWQLTDQQWSDLLAYLKTLH
jgi:cytochrome c oxidase subunit 2